MALRYWLTLSMELASPSTMPSAIPPANVHQKLRKTPMSAAANAGTTSRLSVMKFGERCGAMIINAKVVKAPVMPHTSSDRSCTRTPRAGSFAPLRFVPKGKIIVLGLITTKEPKQEKVDELRQRIDEASKYIPVEQLALSPQCGFASTEEGNALAEEEQWAKLRMIVEVAQEVWG